MRHRGVAAIEHYVGIAHGRKVSRTVDQKQREMYIAFKEKMNQPSGWIGLLCVHQHTAAKSGVVAPGEAHRVLDCVNSGDIVMTQAQREGHRRKQFRVGTIDQNGLPRSHGQFPNAWSSRQ